MRNLLSLSTPKNHTEENQNLYRVKIHLKKKEENCGDGSEGYSEESEEL